MGRSNINTFNATINGNARNEKGVWGVDNVKTEKRKIHVQSKDKKRAGQRKVHSHQETVVYFPKSDKESTN